MAEGSTRRYYAQCRLGDITTRLAWLRSKIVHSDTYINAHADPDEFDLRPPPAIPPQ
jgi:hypothetical protein